jgi:cell division protease FtsH
VLTPGCEPLHKVTIVPRGIALGATMQLPQKDRYNYRKKELEGQLASLMGGLVTEQLVFGDMTTGAKSDIKHATDIARKMVCEWGMSESMGPLAYGEREEHLFLGREIERHTDYSEQTAQKIDNEIRGIVERAIAQAQRVITEHRAALDAIAEALLKYEVLDGEEIVTLVHGGTLARNGAGAAPAATDTSANAPAGESDAVAETGATATAADAAPDVAPPA